MPANRCRPDSESRRDPFVGPPAPIPPLHDGALPLRQPCQRALELGADLVQPRGIGLVGGRCRRAGDIAPCDFPPPDPHSPGTHLPQIAHEDVPRLSDVAENSFVLHRQRPHVTGHLVSVEYRGPAGIGSNTRIVPAYKLTPPRFPSLPGIHHRIGPEGALFVWRSRSLTLSLSLSLSLSLFSPAPRTPRTTRFVLLIRPPVGGNSLGAGGLSPERRPATWTKCVHRLGTALTPCALALHQVTWRRISCDDTT